MISSLYLSNPSTQASDSRYFQYDGLGNVIGRTNQQGNAVTSYSYEAFGAITSQSGQLGNAYTYMGQAYDSSTGLYYMNARWYDASIGRFISADPLPGNPFQSGSTNRYAYAMNNPIAYEDVSGLAPMKSMRQATAQAQGNPPTLLDWLILIAAFFAIFATAYTIIALLAGALGTAMAGVTVASVIFMLSILPEVLALMTGLAVFFFWVLVIVLILAIVIFVVRLLDMISRSSPPTPTPTPTPTPIPPSPTPIPPSPTPIPPSPTPIPPSPTP